MITEALRKLSNKVVRKEVSWDDNEWKEIKIQSTVDEGKHLTNIERQIHIYNEIKKR